jgi:hypothetical protein
LSRNLSTERENFKPCGLYLKSKMLDFVTNRYKNRLNSYTKLIVLLLSRYLILFLALILSAGDVFAQQYVSPGAKSEAANLTGPIVVNADFELLSLNNINEKDETFEFVGILSLKWHDPMLSFDPIKEQLSEKIYQGDYQVNQVFTGWTPQAVLLNQSGLYETSASLLRIEPNGVATLTQMINAAAKVHLFMRRLPFDSQRLEAVFGVFGYDKNKVVLRVDPEQQNAAEKAKLIDQWTLADTFFLVRESISTPFGYNIASSSFVVGLDVQRESLFMVRLIIFPLAFIVVLVWAVFWMDRASIGDRINICFVGILTAVAYQMVLGDRLPQISYMTFLNAFLNISFIMMSATVVANLYIGSLDKKGDTLRADMIEQRCRWIFPAGYFALILIALVIAFLFFN